MEIFDPVRHAKYLDGRGLRVLACEYQLRELGLIVEKSLYGVMPVDGGNLGLYDIQLRKTSERFGQELIAFLQDEIKLSSQDIEQLQQQATLIQ